MRNINVLKVVINIKIDIILTRVNVDKYQYLDHNYVDWQSHKNVTHWNTDFRNIFQLHIALFFFTRLGKFCSWT